MSNRDDDQIRRENKILDEKDRLATQERLINIDRTRSAEAMMAASGYPPPLSSASPSRLRLSLPEKVGVEMRRASSCLNRIDSDDIHQTAAIMKIREILWGINPKPIWAKEELERALLILEDVRPSDPGVKHLKEAIRICERFG